MPNVTDPAVRNLIRAVVAVLEMDLADPLGQLAAVELLACALDPLEDDLPIENEIDVADDADVPHVRT